MKLGTASGISNASGSASNHLGNPVTIEDEKRKLALSPPRASHTVVMPVIRNPIAPHHL